MSDESLTHADLSRLLGVSVTTIKSYRRKFPGFLPALASGKPLRFPPLAARICTEIRDGFARGLSVQDIHRLLSSTFPEYSKNRHLSISQTSPASVSTRVLESLARELADLSRSLDAALARLDRLESSRDAVPPPSPPAPEPAPEPAPAPEPPGKVIRIRARDGSHQNFRLTSLGPDPEEAAASASDPAPQPPPELLEQPLVVRSDQGEFLGLAGTRSRHLRLGDLLDLVAGKSATAPPAWARDGNAWTLAIPPDAESLGQDRVLTLESTTTPRGNRVVLLSRMAVGGKPAPAASLHAFLRQLGKEREG